MRISHPRQDSVGDLSWRRVSDPRWATANTLTGPLAALEGISDEVRDTPEEANNFAVVHPAFTSPAGNILGLPL